MNRRYATEIIGFINGGGFVGNIVNSFTSGEGLVIKFRGHGKVIVCSRNRASYLQWLATALGRGNSNSN